MRNSSTTQIVTPFLDSQKCDNIVNIEGFRPLNLSSFENLYTSNIAYDNPKFYSMVLDFTKSSAGILESRLLDDRTIQMNRSENIKKAQMEALKRSEEQRKKTIRGIFEFMLPCNSILETSFRVKMDDGSTKVSKISY